MKILDKLKNALFEEEYVEVEEKPKKKTIKNEPKALKKKEIDKKEDPIAKKIVLPERKEVKVIDHDVIDEIEEQEEVEEKVPEEKEIVEKSFPMISDNEFEPSKNDDLSSYNGIMDELSKKEEYNSYERYNIDNQPEKLQEEYNEHSYEQPKHHAKLYGIEDEFIPEPEYGTYEKKEEKTYFKPSPIISPIYGILDKNYKKEEIVSKKEVRLTSNYSKGNLDLDEVRNKAYGTLSNDIEAQIAQASSEESNLMDQDLVDLSKEEKPEIKKVTLEDAEEYFNDLGLEYNVDYKDVQKESKEDKKVKITTTTKEYEEKVDIEVEPTKEEPKEEEKMLKASSDEVDDDNLFDLIDSMYEKE